MSRPPPLHRTLATTVLMWLAFTIAAGSLHAREERPDAQFSRGDTVIDVMSGRQGIILRTRWNLFHCEWLYQVRVESPPIHRCGRSCTYGPYCQFDRGAGTVWLSEVELRIVGRYPFSQNTTDADDR